ncbi:transcription factor, putative [Ricinus communis]|uniref:Transcription factor, putative n=1 Tax=Ricinus communis TaxID=3988 RepID=B9RA97_RICCO|nr:transcription factor, putative [Ricinus communis]
MDHKFNLMREGMIKLPPGFRFQPTDEELVFQYLKRKVLSWPLPASIIPDINVCKFDPWDLPGNTEQERYFFSNKESKYPNGNRINRATASGYWKATGLEKQIGSSSSGNHVVGMKKTLVFYRGKSPHATRTDWIMHEYRLVSAGTNSLNQLEKWVLCRIFFKNRSTERNGETIQTCNDNKVNNAVVIQPRFIDFMKTDKIVWDSVSCSSSSSSSSSITEVSSSGEDHEESSSSRNFF